MRLRSRTTPPPEQSAAPAERAAARISGRLGWRNSLAWRMWAIAACWIIPLLAGGGFALDRALSSNLVSAFDEQLSQYLTSLTGAAEVDSDGEVRFTRALGDQRFFEPYSGFYWQVSTDGQDPFRSRSLWDRAMSLDLSARYFDEQRRTVMMFNDEHLRLIERDAILPGSQAVYRFAVAAKVTTLERQIAGYRRILVWSLSLLGVGSLVMSAMLVTYGLRPLRRVVTALSAVRSGTETRIRGDFVREISPLVTELNALLDHTDEQAEQARTHAGNLAHALKTPMSVLLNEARGNDSALGQTVTRQVTAMKRHVDHHLARARALGRRANLGARAPVRPSMENLQRVLQRIYQDKPVRISLHGATDLSFRGDRQDLEEMLGNVMDNACKYGAGQVRVTLAPAAAREEEPFLSITIEDDGPGIPENQRSLLFERGERLDQAQPGNGIGLAIVRDIAEICGGSVSVESSERLGGLAFVITLPAAFQ